MDGIPKLDDSLMIQKYDWLKTNKRKVIVLSVIACTMIIGSYLFLFIHRPTFAATHQLTGDDGNRAFVIETVAPKGSLVTMYKDKTFIDETTAPKGSLVATNKVEEQKVDGNGIATFKIFPGQLKSGLNNIHFKVKVPIGIRKDYYYSLIKTPMPLTLKVDVKDETINNEIFKNVTVKTDPYNRIFIEGFINDFHSITGQDVLKIKDYDILKSAGQSPDKLPDLLETSIQVSVTDVDGQKKFENVPVSVSTFTNLSIDQPQETDSNSTTINGKAPPGANIMVGDQNVIADDSGNFKITAPLPKFGTNVLKLAANRPGEKPSTQIITVDRLMPKVELKVETVVRDHDMTIEGNISPGATVTVNGQPAIVNDKSFSWFYAFPFGVSKEFIFNVKAQKPGWRSSEEKVTIHRKPVIRKPTSETLAEQDVESFVPKDDILK